MSMREAKGCTVSDVPIMIRRSHLEKSAFSDWKKRLGSDSPKNTMSGLTIPEHSTQVGNRSANISSVTRQNN